jgi:Protein of unknown function (DUF4058)
MPSPFPGVDPYLESQHYWPDFHARFMNYWCEALADQLPDNYEARMDERVNLVERPPETVRRVEPDLALARRGPSGAARAAAPGVATLEPVSIPILIVDEKPETFIEILHRPGRTLVAILEVLSPANKDEPGYGGYLLKRNAILRQRVHLVELDLLLSGRRMPLAQDYPLGDYFALVAPGARRPHCDVYAWTVRQPLPPIRIPLLAPDPPILTDLGVVFSLTYDRGRYARSIDYTAAPHPALTEEDRVWAAERARAAATPPPTC